MTKHLQIGFLIDPDVIQLNVMRANRTLTFPRNATTYLTWKISKSKLFKRKSKSKILNNKK